MKVEMKNTYKVQLDEQEYDTLYEAQNIINDIFRDANNYLNKDDRDLFCAFQEAFEAIIKWIDKSHQVKEKQKQGFNF